ncbi:MAG: DUF2442 domain-containing protein [Caldilinea sp.]
MNNQQLLRIRSVKCLDHYQVELTLTDNSKKIVDLEPYLRGPIFEPIRSNPAMFRSVSVDSRMGTIVWENGADIDPDVLIFDLKPAWMTTSELVN